MNFNLKFKLLSLISFTILIPIAIISSLHYNNLVLKYKQDAFNSTYKDYQIVYSKLEEHTTSLKSLATQLTLDKEVKSIVNLISNYQDKNNYNKILFDEEKKKLLIITTKQLQYQGDISFSIFDKYGDVIIINKMKDGTKYNGFISYNKGNAELIDLKTNLASIIPPMPQIVLNAKQNINIKLDTTGFGLLYSQKIYKDDIFIGYIRIKKIFTQNNIKKLIPYLRNNFTFLTQNNLLGYPLNISNDFIIKNAFPFHKDNTEMNLDKLSENKNYHFHIHYLNILENNKLYFISAYDKKLLANKINTLNINILISILISIFISFVIAILFLHKTILSPLNTLMTGINNLKQKKYTLIQMKGDDELSKIAKEFNSLTQTLQDSFERIFIINHDLEEAQSLAKMGSWQLDLNTSKINASTEIYNILGLKPYSIELDIETYLQFIVPKERKSSLKRHQQSLKDKKNYMIKNKLITADNRTIYCENTRHIDCDKNGNIIKIYGILHDITEQELLKIEHYKQNTALLQQSKLAQMGEMLSMIAHQWRQPLNAISLTSSNLSFKCMMNDMDKDLFSRELDLIDEYSQYLSKTIDDFRSFFKNNKIKELTALEDIVQSTLHIVQVSLKNKNIDVITNFNCTNKIHTYPNEVKQVVLNIIKNAEDALLENQIKDAAITITTLCDLDNQSQTLIIQDNAGGIPKDIIDKIFDPYFSTKKEKDGTGLGLYMSKTIIEEHCHAKIEVSNDENGAVFKIKFNILK